MQSEANTLCRACGLCCDGALFSHTPLASELEVSHFTQPAHSGRRSLPLAVQAMDGEVCASQPCAHFNGGDCAIYEQRPNVCRRFRCTLLRSLENDQLNLAQAMNVIDTARHQIAEVEVQLNLGSHGYSEATAQLLRESHAAGKDASCAAPAAPTQLPLSAVALLKFGKLQIWLNRHFRITPQGKQSARNVNQEPLAPARED